MLCASADFADEGSVIKSIVRAAAAPAETGVPIKHCWMTANIPGVAEAPVAMVAGRDSVRSMIAKYTIPFYCDESSIMNERHTSCHAWFFSCSRYALHFFYIALLGAFSLHCLFGLTLYNAFSPKPSKPRIFDWVRIPAFSSCFCPKSFRTLFEVRSLSICRISASCSLDMVIMFLAVCFRRLSDSSCKIEKDPAVASRFSNSMGSPFFAAFAFRAACFAYQASKL